MSPSEPSVVRHPVDIERETPDLLRRTAEIAIDYRASLPERRVGARPGLTADDLRRALGGPMPDHGEAPGDVIDALVAGVEPGLVAMGSPRYFGFVIGGSVPAALAADWLTSVWEQNVGLFLGTPAASTIEEIAAEWLIDLLGLPTHVIGGVHDRCDRGAPHGPARGAACGPGRGRLGRRGGRAHRRADRPRRRGRGRP